MPKEPAKLGQIEPKKRAPYTAAPVQLRVIERHVKGESNREIARQEGIGRDTVGRILSQQEVVERIAQGQARVLDLIPKAIGVYEKVLTSDDLPLATATAAKVPEGMHVLSKGGIEETIALANKASPEAEHEQRRIQMLGQMTDMMINKARRYDMPLPSGLERVEAELKRLEEAESRFLDSK
jgi:hypothetical protein